MDSRANLGVVGKGAASSQDSPDGSLYLKISVEEIGCPSWFFPPVTSKN